MADKGMALTVLVIGNCAMWALVLARVFAGRRSGRAHEEPSEAAVAGRSGRAKRVLAIATATYVVYYVAALAWIVHAPLAGPELLRPTAVTAVAGVVLMVAALAFMAWSLAAFRSWRVLAEVREDHELMTGGPFARVRHPIYTAIVAFYAASFLLVPRPAALVIVVGLAWAHDLRARAEEEALVDAFG